MTVNDFEKMFRANYTRLYYFAYDFTGDAEAGRDIVSEAFVRVWEMLQGRNSHPSKKEEGLLFVTVRNLCSNYLRKRKTSQRYMQYVKASASIEDETYFSEMDDRIAEMQRVIGTMPELTRYVVEECSLNGKTYREVAEAMNISTSTVKKHIITAYAVLRSHFNVKKK